MLNSIPVVLSSGFEPPSIDDFYPPAVLFAGTPFAMNRIMIIRVLVVLVLVLLFWLWAKNLKLVPTRAQVAGEFLLGFVRNGIIIETLGEKDGKRFMAPLMTFFFLIIGMNITGVVPPLLIAGTSLVGLPLLLAVVSYVLMIYSGWKRHGGLQYFKKELFLPGVAWPLHFLLVPIELLSTFILRPVTLTLRLLMNMVAGHLMLGLCFAATQYFFFTMLANGQLLGLLGIGTFAFGTVWMVFEIFVAALQAYVFTFLAAIYIQMSIAAEH